MANQIVQGDFGFDITVQTGADLSSVTAMAALIKPPSGALVEKDLTTGVAIVAPATVGDVKVTIADGDLAVAGGYKIQMVDETPGRRISTVPVGFIVVPGLS